MYKKILVPLDGSKISEGSLPHVKAIALGCSVPEVVLFMVVEPLLNPEAAVDVQAGRELIAQVEKENKAKDLAYIDGVSDSLKKEGISAVAVLQDGKPAEEILAYAGKNGVDLIIMNTHGRSGVSRWILGSVAERVVRHSPVPVLMVSAAGRSAAERGGR
jgi:nucleotide-binding universal stress UspA family protein